MQPSLEEFKEWSQHPVTEWVFACVEKYAQNQKAMWANLAWDGNLSEILLTEAKVRADSYKALTDTAYEDWKAIDDSED